ncbi:hypothetical protein [Maridesulfovibrio sp.]|uniref:hypothetical protein n=1 Tax=Maridesulfovibrio sp. TaxID=2795000 RepID=UPI0029CA0EA5|nr:hypothetical protein [Maridesulfovibrio sp.]
MGIYEDTLEGLRQTIVKRFSSARALAEYADMNPVTLTRWLAEQRAPDFEKLSHLLDAIGARIVFSDAEEIEPARPRSAFDVAIAKILLEDIEYSDISFSDMARSIGRKEEELKKILSGEEPVPAEIVYQICNQTDQNPKIVMKKAAAKQKGS